MIKVKYNGTEEFLEGRFRRIADNVVRFDNAIANTNGFHTYTLDETELGDFSDYTTIYSQDEESVYYSNNGEVAPPPEIVPPEEEEIHIPTQDEIKKQLTDAVQNYLDRVAQEKNYDGILSVCSYFDSGDETFDREGEIARKWRSLVWRTCYQLMDEVLAGEREIPTEEELIYELLPRINWDEIPTPPSEETPSEETPSEESHIDFTIDNTITDETGDSLEYFEEDNTPTEDKSPVDEEE